MASRTSASESRGEASAAKTPGRGMRIVTLLLALYAAGVATAGLFQGGKGASAGSGGAGGKDGAASASDALESRVRTAVVADLDRAVAKDKEAIAAEAKRVAEAKDLVHRAKEGIDGKAETTARMLSNRSDEIDARLDDAMKAMGDLRTKVSTVETTIEDLKAKGVAAATARPVALPTPAPGPAPGPAPTPPAPTDPDKPAGKSPEQLAAEKEVVRKLIEDLLAGLKANEVEKVFQTALRLGKAQHLDAVDALIKTHKEFKDPFGRNACMNALGTLHACDAIAYIVDAFGEKDNSVALEAGVAFRKITGFDSGLSGDSSRREKLEAKERALKFWKEKEGETRAKWGQLKEGAEPSAPGAPPAGPDAPPK